MFLFNLQEKNREAFLELSMHAALANDIVVEEEEAMMFAYCREMLIEEHMPDAMDDFESIVKNLASQTSEKEKRIIILEILGMVKADGIYDDKERQFMDRLVSGLHVEKSVVERLEELLESYLTIYKDICAAIYE